MSDEDLKMRIEAGRAYIRGTISGLSSGLALTAVAVIINREANVWIGVAVFALAGVLQFVSTAFFRPEWVRDE